MAPQNFYTVRSSSEVSMACAKKISLPVRASLLRKDNLKLSSELSSKLKERVNFTTPQITTPEYGPWWLFQKFGPKYKYTPNETSAIEKALEPLLEQTPYNDSIARDHYSQGNFHLYNNGDVWAAANSEVVMEMFNRSSLFDVKKLVRGLPQVYDDVDNSRYITFLNIMSGLENFNFNSVKKIVDLGCGAGVLTRFLHNYVPQAEVLGIDASYAFVLWAQARKQDLYLKQREITSKESLSDKISFKHALAEKTDLLDHSVDLVFMGFVAHELPVEGRNAILKEAYRILKNGGAMIIVDHQQKGSPINAFLNLDNSQEDIVLPSLARSIHEKLEFFNLWNKNPLAIKVDESRTLQWLQSLAKPIPQLVHNFINFGAPEPFLKQYHEDPVAKSFQRYGFTFRGSKMVTNLQEAFYAIK